jgi:tetratricopeptide (TPR) repeat protein
MTYRNTSTSATNSQATAVSKPSVYTTMMATARRYSSTSSSSADRQNASVRLLNLGSDYLSQGKHDEAMSAFDSAFQALSSPSGTAVVAASVNNISATSSAVPTTHRTLAHTAWKKERLHHSILAGSFHSSRPKTPSSFSLTPHSSSSTFAHTYMEDEDYTNEDSESDGDCDVAFDNAEDETFRFSHTEYDQALDDTNPVDTYHEDECDVGPRPFRAAFVPSEMMDVDVLQLIICYNQALVHHARQDYSLALQLYNFITGTIGTTLAAGFEACTSQTTTTLSRLAMRAHNNMGHIEYADRSEEQAMVQFETALGYARKVQDTSAFNQLEIATVLSNWCRVQWMLGRVDETVYQALEEILRIRFNFLGWDHIDVASAHFNLGMAEYSRSCNDKALAHFMQYLQVSSHRLKTNKNVELDPIPGLIFVLLIKNDDKEDKMSQDLVWGLRTLQDKRQDLGPKNSEVASVLNFIGTLLFHQRELDHALLFFQEELRLEEHFVGAEEDVSVSVTCNNIGRILQELGRFPQAIYYYQRSLRHRYGDDFFGPSAPASKDKASTASHSIGCAMVGSMDESLDGSDKDIPPATMNLYSTVWYNLGLIHDKMGAFAEAIRAFRMSLKLRRAMLGRDHSDVACLLYNIGVLQMEQQLLNDATDSFREALRIRRVAATGQLNDRHVVKTLQKLASLHKSKGNIYGALEACEEVMEVLKASVDFEWSSRNESMGTTFREIAELHHAQGNLTLALDRAVDSFRILRSASEESIGLADQPIFLEQEAAALLLIGSLQHEDCAAVQARATFAEAARLIHSSLTSTFDVATATFAHPNAASLFPLLEVSSLLASVHCAPEA